MTVDGLVEWLERRTQAHRDPVHKPDVCHEPVVLITPDRGRVVWDPPNVPPPRPKAGGHRSHGGRIAPR